LRKSEEKIQMGILDSVVSRSFTNEKAGRVVVFPGDRGNRGYVVRSESDELRIRSFLKLFYVARSSVAVLGLWLASEWSKDINYALGRPDEHLLRTGGVVLGSYLLIMVAPYLLLRKIYEKGIVSFVSAQDEVLGSARSAIGQRWAVIIGVSTLVIAIVALFVFHIIRSK
jgi:hypothetical protein